MTNEDFKKIIKFGLPLVIRGVLGVYKDNDTVYFEYGRKGCWVSVDSNLRIEYSALTTENDKLPPNPQKATITYL